MDRQLENAYESVLRRNPGEAEFHQAVREIFESLGPVLDTNPQYVEAAVLSRICEPERQIIFRVPWVDDEGKIRINRGFRVEYSSVLGPYKGGLRFHPSVYLSLIHISEPTRLGMISYAVFCLKKKKKKERGERERR